MNEFEHRVIGPPGCGKTTWLSQQVRAAMDRSRKPLIVSLSRAAALEVADRDLPIQPEELGTLHSYCYRQLGQPAIAEGRLKDWNERYPEMRLAGKQKALDEAGESPLEQQNGGDIALSAYNAWRARGRPGEFPPRFQLFVNRWEQWKKDEDLKDFTDLVEICRRDYPRAPSNPAVIFVDEAQDLDQLQMSLLRQWGQAAGELVVVGDPDQNIYFWRGSDPTAMTGPEIPEGNYRLLEQSYRLPRAVHRLAQTWIDQWPERHQVRFRPRDSEGRARYLANHRNYVEDLLQDLEANCLNKGRSAMLIASCSYMLEHLIKKLRERGLAFHNPRQDNNGAWNPLQPRPGQVTAVDRLIAFMNYQENGVWRAEDLQRWTPKLEIKAALNPAKGPRKIIQSLANDDEDSLSYATLERVLTPAALEAGMAGDLNWFLENLMKTEKENRRHVYEYPIQILRKNGGSLEQLREIPRITVGTIHSVKGAEADAVYIFPDLSPAGIGEWRGGAEAQGALYRLFYVAMTRAREELILCAGFGGPEEAADLDPLQLLEPEPEE